MDNVQARKAALLELLKQQQKQGIDLPGELNLPASNPSVGKGVSQAGLQNAASMEPIEPGVANPSADDVILKSFMDRQPQGQEMSPEQMRQLMLRQKLLGM